MSEDGTADFLNSLSDSRIRVIHQDYHDYLETHNRGFYEAAAEWVAKLDSDDIALPTRLEKQYNFILENPDVAAVFSSYRRIGQAGKKLGVYHLNKDYVNRPFLDGFVTLSTMLCSKEAFLSVGGYRKVAYPVDDFDLALMLQERFKLGVIQEPLIEYRFQSNSFTPQRINTINMMRRYVRFCAVKRRQGMPEPSLVEFLEHYLELPFIKRLYRMIQDQGELYRRLATSYTLGGQTFKGLYFLFLALAFDPKDTFGKIASLFTDIFRKFK